MPLNSRYSTSELLNVMDASLTPTDARRQSTAGPYRYPSFYQGRDNNTVVFAPTTDNPGLSGINLESIQTMLQEAKRYCDEQKVNLRDKKMIFPVVEAQPLLGFLSPRMHLVALHYDPNTRIATVVDSRPWWAAGGYSLDPIKQSLQAGLTDLGLTVDTIAVQYQAVQKDDTHCGAWTAVNIQGFARGMSVEAQVASLVFEDGPAVVQHQIDVVHNQKKEPFQSTVSRSNSTGSLTGSSDDELKPATDIGPYFTEEEKDAWKQAAVKSFREAFTNSEAFFDAFIGHQGVVLNGATLRKEHVTLAGVDTILSQFNESKCSDPHLKQPSIIQ